MALLYRVLVPTVVATLSEAHLGIIPNARAEPDFDKGWQI